MWAIAASAIMGGLKGGSAARVANANARVTNAMNAYNREKQAINNEMIDTAVFNNINNINLQEISMAAAQARQEVAVDQASMQQAAQITTESNFRGVVGNSVERAYVSADANEALAKRRSREELDNAKYALTQAKGDAYMSGYQQKGKDFWIDKGKVSELDAIIGGAASSAMDTAMKSGGTGSSFNTAWNKLTTFSGHKYGTSFGSQQSRMLAEQEF